MAKKLQKFSLNLSFDGDGDLKKGYTLYSVVDDANSDLVKPGRKVFDNTDLDTMTGKTIEQISTYLENKIKTVEGVD